MRRFDRWSVRFRSLLVLLLGLALTPAAARAVPSFAAQTGQPCNACHVGGLGPQLTPFGREFKLRGYTARTAPFSIPLSAFATLSYVRTAKALPDPPAAGFRTNDNLAVDQVSLLVAGGVGRHFGAFVQNTYDGISDSVSWDNADIRAVTTAKIGRSSMVLGLSVNNNPTVQDAFNTLPAWGFPYTQSSLAPSGPASPMVGNLAQGVVGVSAYAWIDSHVYAEIGGYRSLSADFLTWVGIDPFSPGKIDGTAPYVRVAYDHDFGGRNLEVGAFFFDAHIFPGRDESAGLSDHYLDVGFDASYQMFATNRDVVTLNARYIHESQWLGASQAFGLAAGLHEDLQDARLDVSYYWRNRIGITGQVFNTWGGADALLYPASRNGRPDTSGLMVQLDATPFGSGRSGLGPRFNFRVGVQYTAYFTYSGAASNFDGQRRNASDNNTLRTFLWIYY